MSEKIIFPSEFAVYINSTYFNYGEYQVLFDRYILEVPAASENLQDPTCNNMPANIEHCCAIFLVLLSKLDIHIRYNKDISTLQITGFGLKPKARDFGGIFKIIFINYIYFTFFIDILLLVLF